AEFLPTEGLAGPSLPVSGAAFSEGEPEPLVSWLPPGAPRLPDDASGTAPSRAGWGPPPIGQKLPPRSVWQPGLRSVTRRHHPPTRLFPPRRQPAIPQALRLQRLTSIRTALLSLSMNNPG